MLRENSERDGLKYRLFFNNCPNLKKCAPVTRGTSV